MVVVQKYHGWLAKRQVGGELSTAYARGGEMTCDDVCDDVSDDSFTEEGAVSSCRIVSCPVVSGES